MKILKRKPSKICPVCEKRFFREGRDLWYWNKQIYCSRDCCRNKRKDIKQYIKDNSLLVPSGCIEWQRSCTSHGYPDLKHQCKNWRVHRLVWTLEKGEIPKGLFVCHKCDNRNCINIEHLFLGTAKDNTDDMIQKGRQNFAWNKKVFNYDLILKLVKNEFYTYKEIGEQFNCSDDVIGLIATKNGVRRGKGWRRS